MKRIAMEAAIENRLLILIADAETRRQVIAEMFYVLDTQPARFILTRCDGGVIYEHDGIEYHDLSISSLYDIDDDGDLPDGDYQSARYVATDVAQRTLPTTPIIPGTTELNFDGPSHLKAVD